MTKLEQKLIELGYVISKYDNFFGEYDYVKVIPDVAELHIYYCKYTKTYYDICKSLRKSIDQRIIDNLQQAYNQLQRDLEVLKECENS